MRIVKAGILAALGAAIALVSPADARRLLQDGALEAHVLDGDWCGETIYVEIRSPTRDSFAGDAFQIRRMTAILTNILPFECPEARRMTLVGSVGGAAVWQGTASVADGEVAAMPPPAPDALVPLDERTRVREIQQSLNALGYDAGVPDGLMGPATRSAIQAFQSDRGLPATGQPSPDLVTTLRGQGSGQFAGSGGLVMSDGASQRGTFPSTFAQPSKPGPAGTPALMAVPASPQTQALAAQGFETFEGRIVLPAPIYMPDRLREVDFGPVLARMALAAAPEIGQDWDAVSQLTRLLSPEERRRILVSAAPDMVARQQTRLEAQDYRIDWQTLTNLGFNEFQMQRILEGFRDIGQPRLMAEAPTPPIPVLVVCRVSIGDYDFANQRFALGAFHRCDSIGASPILSIRTGFSTDGLLEYLEVPVTEAEAFLAAIGSEREIVAGIALTIAGITPNEGANVSFDLIQQPEAVIFFHDDRFQQEIRRIDLGPSDAPASATGVVTVDPTRLIVKDNAALIARQAALLALASSPGLLDDDRRALAYADLLAEGDQRSLLAGAGVDYEATVGRIGSIQRADMDEFARRRLLALFRSDYAPALAAAAPSPPIPLLLDCRIPVREYDFEEGYFPLDDNIERYCDWRQISADIPAMAIRRPFDVSGLPRGIAVPLAEAQAFKDMHLRSGARVGLELSIVGMKEIDPERGARRFQLEITTDGAVLFSAADEGLRSPIRRFDMQEDEPVAAADVPVAPIQLRQPATAMLLMLKHGLWEPTEQEWRQWAGARARWERNDRNRDWPHFFDGVDISSGDLSTMVELALIPRFMEWTTQRAANLPETLLFGHGGTFSMNEERLRDGRMPLFRRSSGSENRNLAINLAVPADRLYLFRLAHDGTWPLQFQEIAIVLPSAAEDFQIPFDPSALQPNSSVALEADISVTGLRIVSDGRKDHLVADATPTAGRLIDYETGAVVATAVFDAPAAMAVTPVTFPPEAYFPVLYAEMAGEDPLETVYEALGSGLDAFERRERAQQLVAEAQAFDPGPDGVWAVGRLRFDDYDFATGSFPVGSVSLSGYGDGVHNAVGLTPTAHDLFVVRMPPEQAQAWQQANPSHPDYALRVRVRPVSLAEGWTRPLLSVEVLEAELLDEEEVLTANDPSRIRHESIADSASAVEVAAPPPDETEAPPPAAEAPAGFDILGVSLGGNLEKAVSTIGAEIGETIRYEARREDRSAATGANMWDPFNEGVMLRTPDAAQTIMIYHEPPLADQSVTAISRWIFYPEGEGPPVAAVRDLLIGKYGEPRQTDERNNRIYMRWTADMPEDEQYQCDTDAGVLVFGQWTLDDAPWIGPEGPLFTHDSPGTPFVAQVSEPGAFVADGFIGKMEYDEPRCQEMLISLIIMAPDGRTRQILTALSNPVAIAGTVEGNRLTMTGDTAETSVGEIDLKL
ncbi:peptidoglycan-binding protein [Inquilinus sp. CAU 1745]|uniref:peptidoglycan-binding domain-containing protein n=1 Tax=Inquilinus sp. CAU 1745 TaxID=3140369 RepID=UPI00325AD74E